MNLVSALLGRLRHSTKADVSTSTSDQPYAQLSSDSPDSPGNAGDPTDGILSGTESTQRSRATTGGEPTRTEDITSEKPVNTQSELGGAVSDESTKDQSRIVGPNNGASEASSSFAGDKAYPSAHSTSNIPTEGSFADGSGEGIPNSTRSVERNQDLASHTGGGIAAYPGDHRRSKSDLTMPTGRADEDVTQSQRRSSPMNGFVDGPPMLHQPPPREPMTISNAGDTGDTISRTDAAKPLLPPGGSTQSIVNQGESAKSSPDGSNSPGLLKPTESQSIEAGVGDS